MIVPPNILNIMATEDRKKLGRTGITPAECAHKQDHRAEIQMHNQYRSFLHRVGLCQYIYASPNKKSPLPPGWPDWTVFGPVEKVLFQEFKTEHGKLSEDQERVMLALACLGHVVHVPRSYEEARDITGKHFGLV